MLVSVYLLLLFLSVVFLYCYVYYKTVTWAASLMSRWLVWQPIALFAYYLRFINILFNAR